MSLSQQNAMLDHLVLQELIKHLQAHPEIQNIAIMNAGGFCRNCLAKWRHRTAKRLGLLPGSSYEDALKYVYGMPYEDYKRSFQQKATEEELKQFKALEHRHAQHPDFDPLPVPFHSSACCQDSVLQEPTVAVGSTACSSSSIAIAVLVLSDRASKGVYADLSGPAIQQTIATFSSAMHVAQVDVLPDEQDLIAEKLRGLAKQFKCIITCGGTGISKRDVTPQATMSVIDRQLPGIAEMLRRESAQQEPVMAWLSRGVCGTVCNECVIVNLPGHPNAAKFCTLKLLPLLPQVIMKL